MAGIDKSMWSALLALVLLVSTSAVATAQNGVGDAATRAAATRARAGDQIVLTVLRDKELSAIVNVNERGEAAFPKIGVVKLTTMSIGQLQDTLRARYAEYLRVPEIEVSVLRRVVVTGEVRLPNVYMVDGASTVRDVIARAGGVIETGSRDKVAIIRDGHRIPVKGWDRGDGAPTDLQSGDQVVVGRKSWLIMNALPVVSTAVLVTSFVISVAK
jgi:protein involved in polysaccharide export with SLBB domain